MNKGRIIYYDTRDGEMLLDTKYIEDYMNPEVVEGYYLQLEEQYGDRDHISHKFLEYMEHDEEFNKFPHVRVTPDGDVFFSKKETEYRLGLKHAMTDRWYPLFEKEAGIYNEETGAFDADKLTYYYNDFIEYNLRNVCKVVPILWLHPSEVRRANESTEKALVRWGEELFPPSPEAFANELLEHGCIFPLQVRRREGDDKYIILDGSHRAAAMKLLVERNLWSEDKKILTLKFDTATINFINNPEINYKLEQPVVMHIPKLLVDKYGFITPTSIHEYDENIMEMTIDKYLDMVTIFRMYVMELTGPTRRYTQLTGNVLKPSPIIEDKAAFEAWISREE